MIQSGTSLNVIDNSGARLVTCFKVVKGYKSRYAKMGDIVWISIKRLRTKRKSISKTKKGEIYKALIIRTKVEKKTFSGNTFNFFSNSAVLLNKKNKLIGTKIFGSIPKFFRFNKFLKIVSLSSGLNFI